MTDIQTLIEEADRQVGHITDKSKREQLIADLAAALSALSGETETQWEYTSADLDGTPDRGAIATILGIRYNDDRAGVDEPSIHDLEVADAILALFNEKGTP